MALTGARGRCQETHAFYHLPSGYNIQGAKFLPWGDPRFAAVVAAGVGQTCCAATHCGQHLQIAAGRLSKTLDSRWVKYLEIPPEVFQAGPHASLEAVQRSLKRLDAVAKDPGYAVLAKREEFQQTRSLLKDYERALAPPETALQIPPPPVVIAAEPVLQR